ncbi:hypothetical protein [Pseudomonas oryzihabitans]|uniref:hypothetical protein n=1 Tax=Pseudomonas oryzihabitans TaxID=47885 RepID=UPI002895E356|nr:hypothetical protein [Pseudomonas oryzihabitans]MDT3719269.1 hypothetical protein [Pseudomonas oryzihabitans]
MKTLTALFAASLLTAAVVQSAQAEESALRPLGSLIEKHQQGADRTLAENGTDRSLQPSIERQQQRLEPRRALAENGTDRSLQPSIERQQQRLDGRRLAADGAERTLQQWPQRKPSPQGTVA